MFCIIWERTLLVASFMASDSCAAFLADTLRWTAIQFTRNSTTTMVRMMPKFTYNFLPIVMPVSSAGRQLPRLKLKVDHSRTFTLRRFEAPLLSGIECRGSQHRVPANHPSLFHGTIW